MSIIDKKEKRNTVLYVKLTEANKAWLEKESKRLNYGTLSEFIDELVNKLKSKSKTK
jgi:uncharacterized protein YfdQ (DUF2303 family)